MDLDGQNKEIEYVCDITSTVVKANTFNELKGHMVRLKYTIEEEFSFIYKDNSDPKFIEYRAFVEEVKSFVDGWVIDND